MLNIYLFVFALNNQQALIYHKNTTNQPTTYSRIEQLLNKKK